MKKIAFLIPTLKDGGAERVVSNISINLPKNIKHDIILFEKNSVDYPHCSNLIETNLSSKKGILGKCINAIHRIIKLRKIKKINNYDTVISFLEGANIVNILSRRKEKVIVSVRNYIKDHENKAAGILIDYMIRILFNKADQLIVVSNKLKELMIEKYKVNADKIKVIYNPIDYKKIEQLKNEEIETEELKIFDKKVIINVGRLDFQKGQWHLLKAFEYLSQNNDFNLIILGVGPLDNKLKIISSKLGINDRVFFLGFKENPYKYINKADVFVLTSLAEGFPNAILEAMACSVPVVSVDCNSGPRELIEPSMDINQPIEEVRECEYGILTPSFSFINDIDNSKIIHKEIVLADAILSLMNDTEKLSKYREKSKERAEHFYIDKILNEWLEIF